MSLTGLTRETCKVWLSYNWFGYNILSIFNFQGKIDAILSIDVWYPDSDYIYVVPRSTIDDEYANAADRDPKILLTTSRNPSAPLTQFVKVRLVSELSNFCSVYMNLDLLMICFFLVYVFAYII